MAEDWQPTTSSIAALRQRAQLLRRIREFFQHRNVLEVETPVLAKHGVTDPHIANIAVADHGWLQTSPEFAMKRLLAAGSGCVFQIGKAFRDGEVGSFHNPEFTMLEWYRVGFDEHDLMREVEQLLAPLLDCGAARPFAYRDLFLARLDLDPHRANLSELQHLVDRHIETSSVCLDKDQCLDLLFSQRLQPELHDLTFVYDYPASQAALARCAVDATGAKIARRFECFLQGVELANGYYELTDVEEYLRRCEADNAKRAAYGLPAMEIDSHLVAAMRHGLPACAGVALGLDRLLMIISDASSIDEVLSFAAGRA